MSKVDRGLADEAVTTVTGDRPDSYGLPEDNFTNTAYIWAGILRAKFGAEFDPTELVTHPEIVSLMMVGLKIARESFNHKRDNIVDGIGYWLTTDAVTAKENDFWKSTADPSTVSYSIKTGWQTPPILKHAELAVHKDGCCPLDTTDAF